MQQRPLDVPAAIAHVPCGPPLTANREAIAVIRSGLLSTAVSWPFEASKTSTPRFMLPTIRQSESGPHTGRNGVTQRPVGVCSPGSKVKWPWLEDAKLEYVRVSQHGLCFAI